MKRTRNTVILVMIVALLLIVNVLPVAAKKSGPGYTSPRVCCTEGQCTRELGPMVKPKPQQPQPRYKTPPPPCESCHAPIPDRPLAGPAVPAARVVAPRPQW